MSLLDRDEFERKINLGSLEITMTLCWESYDWPADYDAIFLSKCEVVVLHPDGLNLLSEVKTRVKNSIEQEYGPADSMSDSRVSSTLYRIDVLRVIGRQKADIKPIKYIEIDMALLSNTFPPVNKLILENILVYTLHPKMRCEELHFVNCSLLFISNDIFIESLTRIVLHNSFIHHFPILNKDKLEEFYVLDCEIDEDFIYEYRLLENYSKLSKMAIYKSGKLEDEQLNWISEILEHPRFKEIKSFIYLDDGELMF